MESNSGCNELLSRFNEWWLERFEGRFKGRFKGCYELVLVGPATNQKLSRARASFFCFTEKP